MDKLEYDRQASWEPISRDCSGTWDESAAGRPGSGHSSPFLSSTAKTNPFVPETNSTPRRRRRASKDGMSLTQMLLFNVASMCAGIATSGRDVRAVSAEQVHRQNVAPATELDRIDGRYQRIESPFRRTCSAQSAYDDVSSYGHHIHLPRTPQHLQSSSPAAGSRQNTYNSRLLLWFKFASQIKLNKAKYYQFIIRATLSSLSPIPVDVRPLRYNQSPVRQQHNQPISLTQYTLPHYQQPANLANSYAPAVPNTSRTGKLELLK